MASTRITVEAGTVGANLAAFPVMVRLEDLPPEFWSSVKGDGGDIRVKDGPLTTDTDLPFDIVTFNRDEERGTIFAKVSLSSAADNAFYVHFGNPADALVAHDAVNGREAVWSDYHRVFMFAHGDGFEDHSGNGPAAVPTGNVSAFEQTDISGEVNSHQGVAYDGTHYYTVDTNVLRKWDASWTLVASNTDPCGDTGVAGLNHCGDPDVINGVLYVPIVNWDNVTPDATQEHLARFDTSDLSFIDATDISAQDNTASSVAYNPDDGLLYVASYLDGSQLWTYDPADLSFRGTLALSQTISLINGLTFWNNRIWITSDGTARFGNAGFKNKQVFAARLDGTVFSSPALRYDAATDSSQDYLEGLGHTDEGLLLVRSTASSNSGRVYSLIPFPARRGGVRVDNQALSTASGYLKATGLARFTTWTIGLSIALTKGAATQNILSYTTDGATDDAVRATLGWRQSADRLGIWNNADGWAQGSAAPISAVVYRMHDTHNGTSERKYYEDGVLKATDTPITAMPATGANALYFGTDDASVVNSLVGTIGLVYLRDEVLSADWIAAEQLNLADPLSFYVVGGVVADESDEPEFGTDDELTGNFIGVAWIEFVLIEAGSPVVTTTYYWSNVDLPDPSSYHGGYKEPRVLRWGRFRRALSDDRSEYQGASFAIQVSDTDRLIRSLLAGATTKYGFYNRPGSIYMISDADRRLLNIPRLVAKGFIRKAIPAEDLTFRMEFQDFATARFAGQNTELQIPRRVITAEDFPECPAENLGLPVPIIYGEVSDQNLVSTDGDGKGIADVTGLTATVVGVGGSATKRYAVTAMNDVYGNPIGRPHDDHRGETAAVYVTVTGAPEDEDISPSNYIELRWDDMGPNAVQYRIYGRYPTLVRLLDAADKDVSGWVYYDGKRPSGAAEFDSLKMDGIPPSVNSTGGVGSPAPTVDIGTGVVGAIYVGLRTDLSAVGDGDPEEWHAFLVCGHACKSILGWYVGGVAQEADTESASGPWLIPDHAGYEARLGGSPATVYEDRNGHRYTIVYGRRGTIADQAADDSQPLTLNVQGIEDVGDGTGTLIADVPSQYRHFLENWGFQDYQSGAWLDTPTWDDTGDPLIDADSFDAVKTIWEARIVGGCVGGGVIGANGERTTLREQISRFSMSCDDGNGFSRHLAFEITAIDDSAAVLDAATPYSDALQVLRDTLTIEPRMDGFFNVLPYTVARRFAEDTWDVETSVSDATSIANYLETKTAQTFNLWFIRSATIAADLMQRRLDLVKDPPYRVTFDTPLVGWNLELGEIITLSHFAGLGAEGWTDRPLRVRAIDVDIDNFRATIECDDAQRMF